MFSANFVALASTGVALLSAPQADLKRLQNLLEDRFPIKYHRATKAARVALCVPYRAGPNRVEADSEEGSVEFLVPLEFLVIDPAERPPEN